MLRKIAFHSIQAANAKKNEVQGKRVLGAPFLDPVLREGFFEEMHCEQKEAKP